MSNSAYPVNLRVLVVDDDPVMLEVVAMVLRGAGFTSIETSLDGVRALETLVGSQVDLLICDLNMPGMDGIRLLSQVALLNRTPAIILLTGEGAQILGASRKFAEVKGLHLLGVLEKPITLNSLTDLLNGYLPSIERTAQAIDLPMLSGKDVRIGLASNAIQLVYQPKIDMHYGQLRGVEALLRWRDKKFGTVPAPEVIRAAEDARLIDDLTLAVVARAVQDRSTLVREGINVDIALNVSMHSLQSFGIVERMSELICVAGDSPDRFTLEITETHLMGDLAKVLETLIRFRLRGFMVAIDDYGTGAATMQFLMQLPSTEIKIDRSFIRAAARSEEGRVLLQSAIQLGLRLGQIVTVEGIETDFEAHLAREFGCHLGQGYFYGRPMSLRDLAAWIHNRPRLIAPNAEL